MKKLTTMALLLGALTFTACGGNKTQDNASGDATEQVTAEGVQQEEEAAKAVIAALDEQVRAGDTQATATAIEEAKQHIADLIKEGKTAEAYAYAQALKNYVAENEVVLDALKVDGTTTVADAINTATNLPEDVKEAAKTAYESAKSQIESTVENAGESVKDAAEEAVDNAKQQVKDAAQEKVDEAKQSVETAKQKASDAVTAEKEKAAKKVDEAAQKASDKVSSSISNAASKLTKGLK